MNKTNILMIVAATLLTQWHGIQFWSEFVGVYTGWAWSLTLEAAALWLWWQRNKAPVALLASLLLLAGPLFHIVWPVMHHAQQAVINETARLASIELLRDDLSNLESAHATALQNSQSRQGWLNEIQQTRQAITSTRAELRRLEQIRKPEQPTQPWIKAIMQAMALIVVWCVSVMAINQVSKRNDKQKLTSHAQDSSKHYRPHPPKEPATEQQTLTQRIATELDNVLNTTGKTQKQWCLENNFTPATVSKVRTHDKRLANNKETASKRKISAVATALNINH